MSQTLAQLRQEVARRTSEFLQGTATGGSSTSVVDANNLNYVDSYWDEQWVLFVSGTNNGLTRKILTSTQSAQSLTLYSSVPSNVATGDQYEVYRRFSPLDYKNSINSAIGRSWPDFFQTVRAVATGTSGVYQYAMSANPPLVLPSDDSFIGVEYQILPDTATYPYQRLSTNKYDIFRTWDSVNNQELFTLQLKFNPMTNRLIRIIYTAPLQEVSADTDIVHLDKPQLEWLYAAAKLELWRLEYNRSDSEARQDADASLQKAARDEDDLLKRLRMTQEQRPLRRTTFDVYSSWSEE